jgi:dephospho-CoA kinase
VFYADTQARAAMNSDQLLMEQLKEAFGQEIYSEQGFLIRSKLASIVFSDAVKLKKLNALVHPAVFRLFDLWADAQDSLYVIKEAALLFESESYKDCNSTILVKSPIDLKIARVRKRDSISESDVLKRMQSQMTDAAKEKLCEFIINNDEQHLIIPQALQLHNEFLQRAQ